MQYIIVVIISQFVIVLPPWALITVAFWELMKVTKTQIFLIMAPLLTAYISFVVILAVFVFPNVRWLHHINNVAFFVVSFFAFYFTTKIQPSKLIYLLFIVSTYLIFLCSIHSHIEARFFMDIFTTTYVSWTYIVIRIVLLALSIPLAWYFIRWFVRPNIIDNNNNIDWSNMWIVPGILTVVIAVYTGTYSIDHIASLQYLVIVILLTLASFAIYYVIIKMLVQTEENEKLARIIILTGRQLEIQGKQYETLRSYIEETKRARHDMRFHLAVIKSHIDAVENKELNSFMSEYERYLTEETGNIFTFFCDNYAVNSIMQYYSAIAKNEDVAVDARLDLPKNSGVSDTDLCIIFGNCIENAIEACRVINEGKFVKVRAKLAGETLTITIDNSFDGVIKMEGEKFLSRKRREGVGIGVSSVSAVAGKYGGAARFEAKGNVFQAEIMLPLP